MRREFLPFAPPSIGEEEIAGVIEVLTSKWLTTGRQVEELEREFAAFVGAPAALGVSSGTAALHVGLAALGVGPGHAVLTTPMTFCSTVHVIEHLGATPILVDIEPETLNLDPQRLKEALVAPTPRPSAVLPVHYGGHPCEMDDILELARGAGLAVVEDAAHALPARYRGRTIGEPSPFDVTELTAYSFYVTKNMTTGEGGMLVGPEDVIEEARVWSLHGMTKDAWRRYEAVAPWSYDVRNPGFKYNLSDILAVIGRAQLCKLPTFQAARRSIAARYSEAFDSLEEIQRPVEHADVSHAWHLYPIRLHLDRLRISRDEFIRELSKRNVRASVHFIPVHLLDFYQKKYGFVPADFPVALREFGRLVSLPIYPDMSVDDVDDVIGAVEDIVLGNR